MATVRTSQFWAIIPILFIIVFFCSSASGKIIYVEDDAAGANDGTSWNNAYSCLQDALTNANTGDEIHVAKGMYKPDQETVTGRNTRIVASGDRITTFQLKNRVAIMGGYAGIGESNPDARDIPLYKTVLSGDLNGDDGLNFANYSENSYHVVTGSGTNETAVLDGFTITAGNANGFSPYNSGAGMYNDRGSPTVTNCVFTGNSGVNGGGMYNGEGSPVVANCIFKSNLVSNMGGGMFNYGLNSECNPTLINCTFNSNSALNGGGMQNGKQGNAVLMNCTFTRNHGYGILCDNSQATVVNTILWNDSPFEIYLAGGSITVTYSDVRGGWPGIGNIDADPLLVDVDGPDDIPGTEDDDLHLLPDSPCIDAGDNSAILQSVSKDLDGNPRIVNETVDMGAYEADVAHTANTFYVDSVAPGNNDGSSWSNAFLCLQDALAVAQYGDEILVANGVYRPDQRAMMRRELWQIVSSSDWTATFQLIDGVSVRGSYAGFGEPDPDARNIEQYKSVLSGDLNGDDGPGFTNIWDNSYQVVTASGTQSTTVIDGFTITGGNADGPSPHDHGGGIYNVEGSPTLIDCTIVGNTTIGYGGGIYNSNYSDPVLINCNINNNAADYGGGFFNENSNPELLNCTLKGNSADSGGGGGMCNYSSDPILVNCRLIENSSVGGGGMFNEESEPMLSDCMFCGNSSTGSGGGIFNENGNPILLGCVFSENSALSESGGGMHNHSDSQPSLSNCIFTGNSAIINGGAMDNTHTSRPVLFNCTLCANVATQAGGGISSFQEGRPMLVNCILWGNSDESGTGAYSSQIRGQAEVIYSCVQDSMSINSWPGEGNINIDPLFANPENGDYHLKSQTGRWNPISQGWVIDQISSPCIDAGDPSDPVGLESLPNGSRINMGAYGGTPEASLSPTQPPTVKGKASNPYPADGAENVDINVTLSWTAGFDGALHNVYLGIDFDQVRQSDFGNTLVGQQSGTNYDPGTLNHNQTYYWRIDEVDNQGTTITGEVWSFTTSSPPGPPKGRSCFTGNTPVWVDGTFIPISQVASESIITEMHGHNRIEEVQEHTGTFVRYDILLESGNRLGVAENHYFLAESEEWISLKNLKTGTKLKTAKGPIAIVSVTKRPRMYIGKVYNLKIDGSDRYMVGKDAIIVRDY